MPRAARIRRIPRGFGKMSLNFVKLGNSTAFLPLSGSLMLRTFPRHHARFWG